MPSISHTHSKDCPDYKQAAADRKDSAATAKLREERHQALAHAAWLEWSAPRATK